MLSFFFIWLTPMFSLWIFNLPVYRPLFPRKAWPFLIRSFKLFACLPALFWDSGNHRFGFGFPYPHHHIYLAGLSLLALYVYMVLFPPIRRCERGRILGHATPGQIRHSVPSMVLNSHSFQLSMPAIYSSLPDRVLWHLLGAYLGKFLRPSPLHYPSFLCPYPPLRICVILHFRHVLQHGRQLLSLNLFQFKFTPSLEGSVFCSRIATCVSFRHFSLKFFLHTPLHDVRVLCITILFAITFCYSTNFTKDTLPLLLTSLMFWSGLVSAMGLYTKVVSSLGLWSFSV